MVSIVILTLFSAVVLAPGSEIEVVGIFWLMAWMIGLIHLVFDIFGNTRKAE